ncbi:MAG: hypothetical protein KC414_05520 [Romboutsia sp.]|nr:hypothetical protein [Romboutsia sp.]
MTYTKSATNSIEGLDWTAYYDKLPTLVFNALWGVIKDNTELHFEDVVDKVKFAYKNKTERSDCYISDYKGRLEITRPRKCLPSIWVIKKE